jgi:hypothetical protein
MRRWIVVLALLAIAPAAAQQEPGKLNRRAFSFPVCLQEPRDGDPFWFRNPPCRPTDIGWIDEDHHAHITSDPERTRRVVVRMLKEFYGLPITGP